jgi:hypothetical protein
MSYAYFPANNVCFVNVFWMKDIKELLLIFCANDIVRLRTQATEFVVVIFNFGITDKVPTCSLVRITAVTLQVTEGNENGI